MPDPSLPMPAPTPAPQVLALVTGPAGSGRTTALKAFEDIGFEAIDNMPASLVPRLVSAPLPRPLALAIDARNRDFSAQTILELLHDLGARPELAVDLVYLDCPTATLIRRFSETRRSHPLRPDAPVTDGIALELQLLAPLRARADVLVDTSAMSPHDLRAEIARLFSSHGTAAGMQVQVTSFSYKRGLPEGADMVFDCRFLRNPHWDAALRPHDGRSPQIAAYVSADPSFDPFYERVRALVESLLPAFAAEGKNHLSIAFGCTGGRHRSVVMTEKLAQALAQTEWRVSKHHRELARVTVAALEQGHAG
jgi:RNase adapter protein RapZ